ncbi:MAG: zinc-binding dehydrogenase [Chitinophagales bacterium]
MKTTQAAVLVRTGKADTAFELKEVPIAAPGAGEVLIEVEGFGLNFADIMARTGQYPDAPPMPCVLGYDVAGRVVAAGSEVQQVKVGDRVTALTKFGGYARYAIADARALARISDAMPVGVATALTTQYCTAYYLAAEATQLWPGDKVLIHSAAGGVGTALLQYALHRGCEVFVTAGSDKKLDMLKKSGAHHGINYVTQDFAEEVRRIAGKRGVDVIFDAVGGSYVKKGFKILNSGGRILCYGAANLSDKNIFGKISAGLGFGFYHPAQLMMSSKAIIGVNMLRIAVNKPAVLQRCLQQVVALCDQGVFHPLVGGVFPVTELSKAHQFLESRQSTGKITVTW